jgi:hypothetical protein
VDAPTSPAVRSITVDSTGGGETTNTDPPTRDQCVDGQTRLTATGTQTCVDGVWGGGTVGSGN